MREIVHIQAGQCGNQIGSKVRFYNWKICYRLNDVWKMNQLIFIWRILFFSFGKLFLISMELLRFYEISFSFPH